MKILKSIEIEEKILLINNVNLLLYYVYFKFKKIVIVICLKFRLGIFVFMLVTFFEIFYSLPVLPIVSNSI